MNWESLVGPAAMIGLAALGGYGWLRDLRAKSEAFSAETNRRFAESESDRKDLRSRLESVDRETVKRVDFQRFDDKVGTRFEKLEHAVNNGALKTAELLKGSIRAAVEDLLPQIRGHK